MKITILGCGTSTGVPVVSCGCAVCSDDRPRNKRLRTSAFISSVKGDGPQIMIDTGPDFRAQCLNSRIRRLDGVLYTHAHADHILGLDDLRGFNFTAKERIHCYASQLTLETIKKIFGYAFAPDPSYQGSTSPQLTFEQFADRGSFAVGGLEIEAFPMLHGNIPVSGFRIGDLVYATDCKTFSEETLKVMHGANELVLGGLRREAHRTHLTIDEAVSLAQRLEAKHTTIVHMSHLVDYYEINPTLPAGIELGYDGMEINFQVPERN